MLLEFSVGNYLSFRSKTTLSLMATAIKEQVDTNIFSSERYDLLKGAVVYGANASGKSNLIKAMSTMRRLVLRSFEQSSAMTWISPPFFCVRKRNTNLHSLKRYSSSITSVTGMVLRWMTTASIRNGCLPRRNKPRSHCSSVNGMALK